jgi:hypothetical protein
MTKVKPTDLTHQEADLIETGLQMQAQGLELLLAEMRALAGVFAATDTDHEPKSDAATEAETEEGFDNMPV